ncbi:MAG: GAF domain-containing protein [Anaerolineales bacterium]|jgi:GAF domain-containing protein
MTESDIKTIRLLQQENLRLRGENSILRDYVEKLQRVLSALVDLQQHIDQINPETNLYAMIHKLLEAALVAVNSENGSLLLLDEETGELVFVEVIGDAREKLLNYRLPKGVGIAGWAVTHKRARLVSNAQLEPAFSNMVDRYTGLTTKTLICVPLFDGDRRLGAIEVVNSITDQAFSQSDLEILQVVGRLASIAIVEAEKMSG